MRFAAFPTPEEAFMDGFPGTACRVVASAREGDDAYVVLDTGPDGHPYLYGGCLRREGRGWTQGSDGNAPGWTLTDADHDLGTAVTRGAAPRGTVRVRARFGEAVREAPVANGVYLVAWWRVPRPDQPPRAEAFLVDGRWVPASPHA
jgi:hypothetical protein